MIAVTYVVAVVALWVVAVASVVTMRRSYGFASVVVAAIRMTYAVAIPLGFVGTKMGYGGVGFVVTRMS